MKKILVVSYYWPPSGGAGVHRWLGFVKHLCDAGYEVHVYTPENPDSSIEDKSLMQNIHPKAIVVKRKIWEPYSYYKRMIGLKKEDKINTGFLKEDKKAGAIENLAIWIRGNFFIPDARKFWVKPSVAFLKKYIPKKGIDVVITTGPPHSMHLIGLGAKKTTGVKWIADFRDPWTNIDFYKDLKLTKAADKKHHKLEHEVLSTADTTVVVGRSWTEELEGLGAKRTATITNGFDGEIISDLKKAKNFSIGHFGSFTPTRNPPTFWEAIKELTEENLDLAKELSIDLVGKIDVSVSKQIEEKGLASFVNKIEQVPYQEAQKLMEDCAVLLLVANNTPNSKGILTSKLFEYMRTGRPVIALGLEDSDMSYVMKEVYDRPIIGYEDKQAIKDEILRLYSNYKHEDKPSVNAAAMNYHRKNLCKKMIEVIESL